jgi:hypothetical protein
VSCSRIDSAHSIIRDYTDGSAHKKQELVLKYGKAKIENLIQEYESQKWLDENSKKWYVMLST